MPQAAFSPLPQVGLDFGTVEVGRRLARRVTVLNQGQAELHVENVAIEGAAFALGVGDSSATIAPEGRLDLSAAFVPQSEGDQRGILRLSTSDPQAADRRHPPLAGRGQISPPSIEIISGDIDFRQRAHRRDRARPFAVVEQGRTAERGGDLPWLRTRALNSVSNSTRSSFSLKLVPKWH